MKDLMIDIETLGNKITSTMMSISAVQFELETGKTGESFHVNIDPNSMLEQGSTVDWSTISWWMMQDEAARKKITTPRIEHHIEEAMRMMKQWIGRVFGSKHKVTVWGNGASFDMGIILTACERAKCETPWNHFKENDVRTITRFDKDVKYAIPFEGVKHDGVDDCKHQIKYMSTIYKGMRYKRTAEAEELVQAKEEQKAKK